MLLTKLGCEEFKISSVWFKKFLLTYIMGQSSRDGNSTSYRGSLLELII